MHQRRLDLSTCSNRVQPEMSRHAHVRFLKTVTKKLNDSNVRTLSKAHSKRTKPDDLEKQPSCRGKQLVFVPSKQYELSNSNNKGIADVISKKRTLKPIMLNVPDDSDECTVMVNKPHKHNVPYRMLDFWGHDTAKKNYTHNHMIRMSLHMCDNSTNPLDTNIVPDYTKSRNPSTLSGRSFSPEVFTGMRSRGVSPEANVDMPERRLVSSESSDGIPWGRTRSVYNNNLNRHRFSYSPDFWDRGTRTRETIMRRIKKDFIRSPYIMNEM